MGPIQIQTRIPKSEPLYYGAVDMIKGLSDNIPKDRP